jgi:glutamyl-tRNA synthetase
LDAQSPNHADTVETAPPAPPLTHPFEGGDSGVCWRLFVPDGTTEFDDAFAGRYRLDVQAKTGDFIVATKEGLPSYQLAVVIDDARQRIDHIVRGDDLLASTLRQRLLHERLGLTPPAEYIHLPLVVGPDSRRLAKRHGDSRIAHYRSLGVPAERIIGLLAEWCGLGPRREMSACEFAREFLLERMPHERVVFTVADDLWLRAMASTDHPARA